MEDEGKQAKRKAAYARHRERERAYQRAYYAANNERIRAAVRARKAENREAVREYQRRWIRMDRLRRPTLYPLSQAKKRARKRGLVFDLRPDDISIPEFCPILGIPLILKTGPAEPGSPSLDRIDNERGYVAGNVRVISYRANVLKGAMGPAEDWLIATLGWPR